MKLSSVESRIMATSTPDGAEGNIDPLPLGWPEELPDALSCKKPIKGTSIDIIIVEIFILHMKNHFIPPESDSFDHRYIQTTCFVLYLSNVTGFLYSGYCTLVRCSNGWGGSSLWPCKADGVFLDKNSLVLTGQGIMFTFS